MQPIIEVHNIGKKFKIHHEKQPYLSVRDSLVNFIKSPFKNILSNSFDEEFWALKDVSFNVYEGESIGIIGKNGAGKSTLLKILSRITPPSEGKIILRGRVASLLEVGTGFHPELTGRENVFFNGAILGMKRAEIKRKFDEIVDFAGVEKFIDTPLKHYSSGMQLRLAFAVAAFLEAEILVIDEVLAVGDAEFQKKCLGKMEEVSKQQGRTVLFVSHNMGAVENLCKKSILLINGNIETIDESSLVIQKYLNFIEENNGNTTGIIDLKNNKDSIIQRIEMLCNGKHGTTTSLGSELEIKLFFKSDEKLEFPVLGVIFRDSQNNPIIGINNKHYIENISKIDINKGEISMKIPSLPLYAGIYHIDIHFGNSFIDLQVLKDCFTLHIDAVPFTNSIELPDAKLNKVFIKNVDWKIQSI
ncbi:MAG TPA: ABC transporter ATP-binding protein [Bacteroidia bacterium]|nr:ABC transporter ATP-binding protein [Bacteroidia bacterium]